MAKEGFVIMAESKRDVRIDVFKGLCIFFMVLGHAWAPFVLYIYLFHMPAFLVASGYTYNGEKEKYFHYILKKVKILLLPFFVINMLYIILSEVLQRVGLYETVMGDVTYSTAEKLKMLFTSGSVTELGGVTWFLPVLFLSNIIYKTIEIIGNALTRWFIPILSILCFLSGWIFIKNDICQEYYLDLSLFAVGFFAFGRWLASNKILENKIEDRVMLIISIAVTYFFGSFYYETLPMNWPSRSFDNSLFIVIVSVIFPMYCCWKLAETLAAIESLKRIFSFIGKRTYSILILHFAAFKIEFLLLWIVGAADISYLQELTPRDDGGIWWLLFSCGAILICVLISRLAEKTRVTNYLVNAKG